VPGGIHAQADRDLNEPGRLRYVNRDRPLHQPRLMRSFVLASTLLLMACPAPDGDPTPDPLPEPVTLTGTYQVTSEFAVPATVAAPGPLGDSLRLLHQLSVNPASALLDLADSAGVPAVGTLRTVLPSALEDELEGWMNGYLETATVDGASPLAQIRAIDAQIRSVLLDWDLESTLVLPATGPGTHAPDALVFSAAGEPVVIPVDFTAPVTAGTGVVATVSFPAGASPAVAIGDHAMGIPFGSYALRAIDFTLQQVYGVADLRDVLGQAVDCGALAASVADECVAMVCVGHETELQAICEGGLDEAAAQLEERIHSIDFQAIHFESGTATAVGIAVDAPTGAASATRLDAGTWAATIDLGQEPEAATATFTAFR